MTGVHTARVDYEQSKADASDLIDRTMRAHSFTQAAFAVALGIGETMVAEWCKPEKPRAMPFAAAKVLPEAARIALAQELVGSKYLIVEAPVADRADNIDAACEMMAKAGQLAGEIAASYRDGNVDRAEGARGAPVAMTVARLALGAHGVFLAAVREGVVRLRAVEGGSR